MDKEWEVNYQLFSKEKVDSLFDDWVKAYNRRYWFHPLLESLTTTDGIVHNIIDKIRLAFTVGYAHRAEESIRDLSAQWTVLKDNPTLPQPFETVVAVIASGHTKGAKYVRVAAYVNQQKQWRQWYPEPVGDAKILNVLAWYPYPELPKEFV